jgi:hypothetical protein
MSNFKLVLLTATFMLAMAFTFSCSDDSSSDGGNNAKIDCIKNELQVKANTLNYVASTCGATKGEVLSQLSDVGSCNKNDLSFDKTIGNILSECGASEIPIVGGSGSSSSGGGSFPNGGVSSSSVVGVSSSSIGGTGTNPTITIVNNTGVSIPNGYMKLPTATNWGVNRLTTSLANGSSREITLPEPVSGNSVYDFMLRTETSGGTVFRKHAVTVSNGMTITITDADLSDGREYPTIIFQNRIGKNYDGLYVKSSVSDDWGTSVGTVSNNNEGASWLIPVRPSINTTFDFQIRTSNPANTYTKRNVTVTDGMNLMITTADSDTPLTGNPVIVIVNNTDQLIPYVWIKPAGSEGWGSDLLSINLQRGQSYTFTLGTPLSVQDEYDVRICGMFTGQDNYVKWNVTLTEGMVLIFDSTDKY